MSTRNTLVLLSTILLGVLAAAPHAPAKSKSQDTLHPATTSVQPERAEPQATKSKTTDASRQVRPNSINSGASSDRHSAKLPLPEVAVPAQQSDQTTGTAAAAYKMDWVSINHGGAIEVASGNLKMGLSVAQTVAGEVSSGNLKMGLGFWYGGAPAATCSCPYQADLDADGFPTSLDLGWLIDIAYGGAPDIPNPGCPTSRGDFDNDGYVTIIDVAWMIEYVYAGGEPPCDPCNAVQTTCTP